MKLCAIYMHYFVLLSLFVCVTFANENLVQHSLEETNNQDIYSCVHNFEGFGVHLGAISHLNRSSDAVIENVADLLYNDLRLRYFRTSYEPTFSPVEDEYDISCKDSFTCTWNKMHEVMMKYPDAKIFASIWSPPYYMKNELIQLKPEYELKYYQFIKNITFLIEEKFNQTMELVSLINEPENFVAPWDHCNMGPHQICKMVDQFDDPLISACTENSWFTTTQLYMIYNYSNVNCKQSCKIVLTHAYILDFNPTSPEFLKAYYDLIERPSNFANPVWQTEVSSTYGGSADNQMKEALDMSVNIVQFVGTTCVSRYYFWTAYTMGSSGESLIWGGGDNELIFPKKYFAYKQFTLTASVAPISHANRCDRILFSGHCLQLGDNYAIFVNRNIEREPLGITCSRLCCTTEEHDFNCEIGVSEVPSASICSCRIQSLATTTEEAEEVSTTEEPRTTAEPIGSESTTTESGGGENTTTESGGGENTTTESGGGENTTTESSGEITTTTESTGSSLFTQNYSLILNQIFCSIVLIGLSLKAIIIL